MPKPRSLQVSLEATAVYHCISRCVRRAFLCGQDRLTGKNFDHRKQWLVDRMQELAGIFALDLCNYAVLSNHFHLIVRIHCDRAQRWTDDQVAERYAKVFPHTVRKTRGLPEPVRAKQLALWRQRLWDLSWFMRCLNEAIARRANREDECTGRFWEGRFRSQALLDEGALLACMTYVGRRRHSPRNAGPVRSGCRKLRGWRARLRAQLFHPGRARAPDRGGKPAARLPAVPGRTQRAPDVPPRCGVSRRLR